ncbi:MAG: hypothetical protein ACFFBD_04685 [Candidatus Hodarchaeota archaeon]
MQISLESCLKREDVPVDVKELIRKEISERKFIGEQLKNYEEQLRFFTENAGNEYILAQEAFPDFPNINSM